MNLTETIIDSKYDGELKFIKSPLHFEKSSNAEIKSAPSLGEHTNLILKDILGYN
jgi:crotonobetainyl-CoA:carnitine CoA-transferase CaiB-like acyl-CoA transferase